MERDCPATLSRRRLLTTAGTLGAGLTVGPAVAGAQENENGTGNDSADESEDGSRINTRAIMPETDRISSDQDYTGFFLQLTNRLDDTQVAGVEECDFADWDPGNTDVYETQLVNEIGDDTETLASSVYLPRQTDLRTGDVFVINNQHDCPEEAYIGIQLEQLRAGGIERGYGEVDDGDGGDDGGSSGAVGPGFGPLAAVGGIAGGLYALLRGSGGE